MLKLLVKAGADPNIANTRDRTPLIWAASGGHLDCCKFLLEECKANINSDDNRDQMTPVMYACSGGHLPVVQYLIEEQKATLKHSPRGWSALLLAAQNGRGDISCQTRMKMSMTLCKRKAPAC